MRKGGVDKIYLATVITLLVTGTIAFISASMGVLAKDSTQFASVAFRHIFFGVVLGSLVCFLFSRIQYKVWRSHALLIFIASLVVMVLVFVPGLGLTLNGARRWIDVGGLSFQPIAFFNMGFIVYWAAWLAFAKEKIADLRYGLLPILVLLGLAGGLLLAQPDTDSFLILCAVAGAMFLVAGGKIRHVSSIALIGIVAVCILALMRPYVWARIETFFNPAVNGQTTGYQVQQSLIAVGSGQVFGRGVGQSIQKYKFLPESMSDSIFAVFAEELGFVGCFFVLVLFLFFAFRSFRIAVRAPDLFSGLLVVGITVLIITQSFINIGSAIGAIPFFGTPLIFFSQGGTSMFMILAQIGIVLNISRTTTR